MSNERLRRQASATRNIVMIIAPTPRLVDGRVEIAFIILDQQRALLNGSEIYETIMENDKQLAEAVSKNFMHKCVGKLLHDVLMLCILYMLIY